MGKRRGRAREGKGKGRDRFETGRGRQKEGGEGTERGCGNEEKRKRGWGRWNRAAEWLRPALSIHILVVGSEKHAYNVTECTIAVQCQFKVNQCH